MRFADVVRRDGAWLCNAESEIIGWECPDCGTVIMRGGFGPLGMELLAGRRTAHTHKCVLALKGEMQS